MSVLGGEPIYVGGVNFLNAAQPTRGIYANYSNGGPALTTGPCNIVNTTWMICTTAPGFGSNYQFLFWFTTSSLSSLQCECMSRRRRGRVCALHTNVHV